MKQPGNDNILSYGLILRSSILLMCFLFLIPGQNLLAQSPVNPGFEISTPFSWTQQPPTTDLYTRSAAGSRTGSFNITVQTASYSLLEMRSDGTISVPNNAYVHVLGFAKTSTNFSTSVMHVGVWMNNTAYNGSGVNMPADDTYTRVTHSTQNTTGSTQNASARLLNQRTGGPGAPRNYQWDDIIMYTSNSNVTDITKPVTPTGFIRGTTDCSSISFSWTNGSDAGTGVQETYILRTTNLSAPNPEMNDQGQYSTTGTIDGPNVVGADWTIISTSVSSGSTTYNDNTVANGVSYKYAIVHRDLAYNYSSALVSGAVSISFTTPPTITGTTPATRCGTGTVTLGATSSSGIINWYATLTGGSSLGTGTGFTTPSLSFTTIYYVDANINGCTTTSRTAVTATINPIPTISGSTPAARCSTGTVSLGATASAGTINWYAAASGGSSLGTGTSFTTPSIASTTIYYADATANGCATASRTAVTATVNAIPTITGTTPAARCGTGTVTLGATASAGTINWYAASTGGSSLGTGISFTTPSISSTTIYYVDATANGCTTASRTAVTATVNAIPTITGTTPASRCSTGTVSLGATASAGTINWYAAASGGSSLGTGTSYTTPSISSTTIYYVDATANGCTTASRTAVTATINAIPTISGTTPAARCGTGAVNLGATASAGTINWYAAATGGSSLGTGTVFTSPSISSTTIYYADATANGCTTASRTAVTATVNAVPVITGTTFVCVSSTTQLSGSGTPAASNAWTSSATSVASVSATGLVTGVSAGSGNITYTNNLGCSITASVTVNPLPSASISYPSSPFCSGSGSATVSLSGTSGGSFSATTGLVINEANGTINVSASANGTYTVTYTVAAAGGCAQYQTTTSVSIVTAGTWTGTLSQAWNNGGNWLCGQVPTNTTNVTIPSGTSYSPLVNTGDAFTKDLTIQLGAKITVDGGALIIAGTVSNAGLLDMSKGRLTFDGLTAQTIPVNAGGTNTIKDLVINNAAGVSMAGPVAITNSLTINNGSLNTGDQLTLKSTATQTARIAALPVDENGVATAFINGKVTVERHIPARKAWRLLSAPVFSGGAPSISAAWQEGVTTASASPNINPGYGVHIQGGTVANGFDQGATSTPSIKYYSNTANNFLALPATPGTNAAITAYPGYFVYIRGDRGINLLAGNAAATTAATLRVKGNMNTGKITTAVNATNYTVLGNPYASAIDFGTISKTNVKNAFYVWDPKLSGTFGLGAYVCFSWNSSTSSYDATSAASPLSQYIQSGEAILIESADGVNPGSVTIKESDKTASGSDMIFGFYNGPSQKLRVDLLAVNADASTSLLDGVLTTYADNNSNNIDNEDAKKLNGGSENIGIKRGSTMLSIERRATITDKDTSFLNLYQMKIASYKLEITADNLDANNTVAVIKDSYSNTINNAVLNPNGTTIIPFSINYDPASYAIGRFSIVFRYEGVVVLPVSFKTVKASKQKKEVLVEWAVENELNVKHYEVERSVNARDFEKINSMTASAVNGGNAVYEILDRSPVAGRNYYRVKSLDLDNKIAYSQTVQVLMAAEKAAPAMQVFPNPGTGGLISLRLKNIDKGDYTLSLYNSSGQMMAVKTIQYDGVSATTAGFELNDSFAADSYTLHLSGSKIKLQTTVMKW